MTKVYLNYTAPNRCNSVHQTASKKRNPVLVQVPADWNYPYIPFFTYDEDGEPEVDNLECKLCAHNECKCIDHKWMHFARPWFSSDVLTTHHTICRAFLFNEQLYPAGYLIWKAVGGFDGWHRLWVKQWHSSPLGIEYKPRIPLIRANQVEGREFSDDVYIVSYDDFLTCNIVRNDGIHCLDYRHIERSRNQKDVTGYKWVYEGPGIWIP